MTDNFKTFSQTLLNESKLPWLLLSKPDKIDEQTLNKIYSTKPGEINIILSRVVDFIKGEHPGKTKRDIIVEILDVLARSFFARQFVSLGLNQNYKLFKGFPVRKGDPYDFMPDSGHELKLQPKDQFLSWTTDASSARETGATFDATKGDPIGGMLVRIDVDSPKILFDINAVMRAVKNNYKTISAYNDRAAPGMSLSKTNTEYLANEAQYYVGDYEVITQATHNVVHVVDKWEWKGEGEGRTVHWIDSDKKEAPEQTEQPEQPKQEPKQEEKPMNESVNYSQDDNLLEGEVMDFFSRAFGTLRGTTLAYLDRYIEQLGLKKDIFIAAEDFLKQYDADGNRAKAARKNADDLNKQIAKWNGELAQAKSDKNYAFDINALAATPLKENEILDEGISPFGILSWTKDKIASVGDKLLKKKIERSFNKLSDTMKKYQNKRIETLDLQKRMLEQLQNKFKNTKFAKGSGFQKITELLSRTDQAKKNVEEQKALHSQIEKDAHDLDLGSGDVDPQLKADVQDSEQKEQQDDAMAQGVADAATKDAPANPTDTQAASQAQDQIKPDALSGELKKGVIHPSKPEMTLNNPDLSTAKDAEFSTGPKDISPETIEPANLKGVAEPEPKAPMVSIADKNVPDEQQWKVDPKNQKLDLKIIDILNDQGKKAWQSSSNNKDLRNKMTPTIKGIVNKYKKMAVDRAVQSLKASGLNANLKEELKLDDLLKVSNALSQALSTMDDAMRAEFKKWFATELVPKLEQELSDYIANTVADSAIDAENPVQTTSPVSDSPNMGGPGDQAAKPVPSATPAPLNTPSKVTSIAQQSNDLKVPSQPKDPILSMLGKPAKQKYVGASEDERKTFKTAIDSILAEFKTKALSQIKTISGAVNEASKTDLPSYLKVSKEVSDEYAKLDDSQKEAFKTWFSPEYDSLKKRVNSIILGPSATKKVSKTASVTQPVMPDSVSAKPVDTPAQEEPIAKSVPAGVDPSKIGNTNQSQSKKSAVTDIKLSDDKKTLNVGSAKVELNGDNVIINGKVAKRDSFIPQIERSTQLSDKQKEQVKELWNQMIAATIPVRRND